MFASRGILILIILFQATFSWCQNSLHGTITNESGAPLIGAGVYISDLNSGTTTNEKGEYTLNNLPKGALKIQFSFLGYESEIRSVNIDSGDNHFDLHLHETIIEAHEVVISTAYPSSQDENPVKVEQMSMKELKKLGGISLMESISNMPGVSQISTGAGIGKPVIRGLSYNRVLVYSLGTRLENQQWGDEHGLGLSGMGVERVEIIKGPSSLLYGPDAMGGVMHLIEEKPAPIGKIIGDYNAQYNTNTQGYNSNLGIKASSKKIRFSLRGGTQSHADYMQGNGIRVTNSRYNGNAVKTSLGYSNHFISSAVNASYVTSLVGIPEEISVQNTDHAPIPSYQNLKTLLTSWQNTLFLGRSKLKVNLGYLINDRREFEVEGTDTSTTVEEELALGLKLKTFNYDVKFYTPKTKLGEVIFGVQGMNQINANFGSELLIPDAKLNDIGLSIMTKYDFKKLLVQAGLRVDNRMLWLYNLAKNYSSINGALGGTYKVGEKVLFRANVATGYRAPNLSELTSNGAHPGTIRYEIGNINLKNERNIEFDLSSHLHTEHATADIAGYYNLINNYIYISPDGYLTDGFYTYHYVQSNAFLYGGEFTLDLHPHPAHWLHVKVIYSTVDGQKFNGEFLPYIPANKLTTSLNIELEPKGIFNEPYINLSNTYVFNKNNVANIETNTSGYNLLNIAIGSEIKVAKQLVSISVNANNLLNTTYYDHLSRLKNYGLYNPGRNIQFSLKIPFGIK